MNTVMLKLMPVLMSGGTQNNKWTLDRFLNNLLRNGRTWGGTICMLIGLVMLIAGVYKAAKKLIQGQAGGQTSWVTVGLLIMFGAVLLAGGFGLVNSIGTGLGDTLKALGEG